MSTTMAITRPIRTLVGRALATALVLGAAGCSTYPAAPAEPAFDTDVLPIFQSHCTRCHDNNLDGGPLHQVFRPDASGGPIKAGAPQLNAFGPCYPTDGGVPLCYLPSYGAAIHTDIHRAEDDSQRMPLPPSRPLNEWEMNVVDTWLAEPSPICSRSKNPDPALLCP
jgi:hypothetical protein